MTYRPVPFALSALSILALGCKGNGGSPSTPVSVARPVPADPSPRTDAPVISSLHPILGRTGDEVTIEGTHLEGVTKVHFGGVEATDFLETDGVISVLVPAGAKSGPVGVHCRAGKAASPVEFIAGETHFDPAVDVAPFNRGQVKNWPGLTNTGSSCFLNAAIKVLASLKEVDDSLRDHPGDDAAMAGVRRQLRFTLNYIRLGDRRPADAQDPMRGLIDAFQHHPKLRHHVSDTQGAGGFDDLVLNDILEVLGLKGKFDIRIKDRSTRDGGSPIPFWQDHPFSLVVSPDRQITPSGPSGQVSLDAYISHVTTQTLATSGMHVNQYPYKVPSTARIQLVHMGPKRALEFSPRVGLPLYQVDEASSSARRIGTMGLIPTALTLRNRGHMWAAIRGTDGWYVNDDARKPYKVEASELNGLLDPQGNLVRETGVIFLRRTSLVKP